ncbi:MAG: hypothetical protein HGA49_00235 [Eubacteriaceae bacterium]|nr:hypothetical protein [Eubacteriaceae bacterium]
MRSAQTAASLLNLKLVVRGARGFAQMSAGENGGKIIPRSGYKVKAQSMNMYAHTVEENSAAMGTRKGNFAVIIVL